MLQELGRETEALLEAEVCLGHVREAGPSLEVLQVADLFFDLQQFRSAGDLYARLINVPRNDKLTRRLLICLVESDQRRRARALLDQLASDVQDLSSFRRIEANLARRMGDWVRMRELLSKELEQRPEDLGVALGYIGALYQLGDTDALRAYLATDPNFKNSSPQDEFEFSKYQSTCGMSRLAILRVYRLYRANSASTEIASFYLLQLLMMGQRVPELEPPTEVGAGTVVHLYTAVGPRIIAIDIESSKETRGWPELVPPHAPLVKNLWGLKLHDKVILDPMFDHREVEVVRLESLYAFAARKAHEQLALVAAPEGPLWSVRIVNDAGHLDVEILLKSAQQRKRHVLHAFELYQKHRFPIAMLAKVLGLDPVTLLMDWPFREATLFVGFGGHEERDSAVKILQDGKHRYVLDLFTIAELIRRKSFGSAVKLLGRPLVPQTVREHLLVLMQLLHEPLPSASLAEHEGHLQVITTPPTYYEDRATFLSEMLRNIDQQCDVVPTAGPQDVTDLHSSLAEVLDNASLDVLYLCIERGAVLISDDGGLRLLAPEAGVMVSDGHTAGVDGGLRQGLL